MAINPLIDQDLDALLADDFGETATIAGVDVPAFFETHHIDALDGSANGTVQALLVKSSVIANEGDSVVFDGEAYSIIEIEHPSRDTKRLFLSRDARFSV